MTTASHIPHGRCTAHNSAMFSSAIHSSIRHDAFSLFRPRGDYETGGYLPTGEKQKKNTGYMASSAFRNSVMPTGREVSPSVSVSSLA